MLMYMGKICNNHVWFLEHFEALQFLRAGWCFSTSFWEHISSGANDGRRLFFIRAGDYPLDDAESKFAPGLCGFVGLVYSMRWCCVDYPIIFWYVLDSMLHVTCYSWAECVFPVGFIEAYQFFHSHCSFCGFTGFTELRRLALWGHVLAGPTWGVTWLWNARPSSQTKACLGCCIDSQGS